MAKWKIVATYEHEGVVEAKNEQEAERVFLENLTRFYAGTDSYTCVRVCDFCEEELEDTTNECQECEE